MKRFALSLPLLLAVFMATNNASAFQTDNGKVRFSQRGATAADPPASEVKSWFNQNVWRMTTYTTYWDHRLSWYPNAWVYIDLYGISTSSSVAYQHPDWILKDSSGNNLYIPWGCWNNTCPNYAGDFSNAGFRNWWISRASQIIAKGYKGIWIDDVDMNPTVGNGQGNNVMPYDPNTGGTMTTDAWDRYMVSFLQQIRSSLPNTQLVHNTVWFAGGANRDYNPYVIQQIQAADYINCERGISDGGLTNGTGQWSVNAFLSFIDHVHSLGKSVVLEEIGTNLPYNLAGYFLISNGYDSEANDAESTYNWWNGYTVDLGPSTDNRYNWSGLIRRDFSKGMVLLNLPGNSGQWASLPGPYVDLWGNTVTGVWLTGGQGAVLKKAY